jgi:hypothetical protein
VTPSLGRPGHVVPGGGGGRRGSSLEPESRANDRNGIDGLFLDTAGIEEIRQINRWGMLSGVTTNPTLVANTLGLQRFQADWAKLQEELNWATVKRHRLRRDGGEELLEHLHVPMNVGLGVGDGYGRAQPPARLPHPSVRHEDAHQGS